MDASCANCAIFLERPTFSNLKGSKAGNRAAFRAGSRFPESLMLGFAQDFLEITSFLVSENCNFLEPMQVAKLLIKRGLLRELALAPPLKFGPLELELLEPSSGRFPDGTLLARWPGYKLEKCFGFECRTHWTPRALEQFGQALREHGRDIGLRGAGKYRARAPGHGLLPLVVAPYFDERQLREIAARGISGLDLSGNGVFIDPPNLFVLRSGAKNRYRRPVPSQTIYRSSNSVLRVCPSQTIYRSWKLTSLVARVLLLERWFPSVQAVLAACHARMMHRAEPLPLTLPTVSKALSQLAEELVILRKGREIGLSDPVRLLDGLDRSYRPPESVERFTGRTALEPGLVWSRLRSLRPGVRVVATGRGSAAFHTGLAGPDRLQLYVSDLEAVVAELDARPSQAFPNLELVHTEEESAFFDAREHGDALWSSPIQAYLELASGSAREVDVAQELRARLLERSRQAPV